jgi:hypothetical protein
VVEFQSTAGGVANLVGGSGWLGEGGAEGSVRWGKEATYSISMSVTGNSSIFAGRWLTEFLLLADR